MKAKELALASRFFRFHSLCPLFKLGREINNLPTSVRTCGRRKPVPQMHIAGSVF